MKNLYPKGKGKIHPSPSSPSAAPTTGGGGTSYCDALAVLRLLPAAILALTAALGNEDKEVLAYLMTRSMKPPVARSDGEERRRILAGAHRPLFDCGCFDCYTSFWSRWDCSPDRELIHHAIEAFEEHLASAEQKGRGKQRRREKGKKKSKGKEVINPPEIEAEEKVLEDAKPEEKVLEAPEPEIEKIPVPVEPEENKDDDDEVEEKAVAEVSGGERRRGWVDVMGILNPRLWSLWSPGE
ncbi:uncharacterized protein [Typha latifolia]|uniref:uncharacterized protein n=1 Tax=Typha latifolia TaxID=4733 RepID=UPI003C2C974C